MQVPVRVQPLRRRARHVAAEEHRRDRAHVLHRQRPCLGPEPAHQMPGDLTTAQRRQHRRTDPLRRAGHRHHVPSLPAAQAQGHLQLGSHQRLHPCPPLPPGRGRQPRRVLDPLLLQQPTSRAHRQVRHRDELHRLHPTPQQCQRTHPPDRLQVHRRHRQGPFVLGRHDSRTGHRLHGRSPQAQVGQDTTHGADRIPQRQPLVVLGRRLRPGPRAGQLLPLQRLPDRARLRVVGLQVLPGRFDDGHTAGRTTAGGHPGHLSTTDVVTHRTPPPRHPLAWNPS
ncbi:hypothetical protein [Ornithinimicrobium kibberense]|uniref:hypothetical protein n=1 Tax=Ornithinimicrobium kibberense TaxID=282060 RepID=UPI003619690A